MSEPVIRSRRTLGLLLLVTICLILNLPGCKYASATHHSQNGTPTPSVRESKPSEDGTRKPADFFADGNSATYEGYEISRQRRTARLDYPPEASISFKLVNVSYVIVKRAGKLMAKFDDDVYFGMGNSADFGYFPFLPGKSKQLFISQDVFRGGRQWIVSLSPRFNVIFDGKKLAVGREGADLSAVDIDRDGFYEITAPITDFYLLQDKMSISLVPLPLIVFKYDVVKEKYLPANSKFRDYVMKDWAGIPAVDKSLRNEFEHRSAVLSNLLTLVYVGEEEQGWEFFDKHYKLEDRQELQLRVKNILKRQPVYNLIYPRTKRK